MKQAMRFIVIYFAVFACGTALHYSFRSHIAPIVNGWLNAKTCGWLLGLMMPSEHIQVKGSSILSDQGSLLIAQGCEGIDAMLMLFAAIVAFPVRLRPKVFGVVAGILFLYIVNIGRLIMLFFSMRLWPSSFEVMHLLVGQTIIIVTGMVFFLAWMYLSHLQVKGR